MKDWADRRAQHICSQFDDLKGYEGIIADELRLARRWTIDEAAGTIMLKWGNQEIADFLHTLKEIQP